MMAMNFSVFWIYLTFQLLFITRQCCLYKLDFNNFTKNFNDEDRLEGNPDNLFFKVQKDDTGKLSVVFNYNNSTEPKNIEYNAPFLTNIVKRSTTNMMAKPTSTTNRRQTDIVFPDSTNNRRPSNRKCAKSEYGFCVELEDYPVDHIESALKSYTENYSQFFGDDVVESDTPNITQRIDIPLEEPLCVGIEKVIYPKGGFTKNNDWSVIINQDNFTQGIRVEECLHTGKPCSMSDLFPNGYKTECRQSYIYRHLLSFNETEKKVVKDLFRFPSCCKCIIKNSNHF